MPEKHGRDIVLKIVVNGQQTEVRVNEEAPLSTVIPKALEQTKNTGQPPSNWELKDSEGNVLDINKKVDDFHFKPETILFLSLKAGVGGTIG